MKAIEQYRKLQQIPNIIEVPHAVWTLFGENSKIVEILGKKVYCGCDYKSLEETRSAIAWFVDQFGGKVEWEK